MAFTLRVVFEGILAYVPDKPFFERDEKGEPKPGSPTKVWVLVPRLLPPDLADWDRTAPPLDPIEVHYRWPHVGLISVPRRFVKNKQAREFSRRIADLSVTHLTLVRMLTNDLIRFVEKNGSLSGKLQCNLTVPTTPAHRELPGPNLQEQQSLWWLPRLADIAPEFATLKPVNDPGKPGFKFKPSDLSAAICLEKGRLFVTDWNRKGKFKWEFTEAKRNGTKVDPCGPRMWNRAIARQLVWEVEISGSSVDLQLGDDTEIPPPLRLRPTIFSPGPVELSVTCMEPEVSLLSKSQHKPFEAILAKHFGRFDPDFQVFYDLAKPPLTPKPRRYPYDRFKDIGLDGKPCAGGSYG